MKILRLVAENVKRLNVVEITPDGAPIVVIAGENEAGKSSVLDAIEMAFGGKDAIPAEPIRRGATGGKVVADLGDLIVTRRFTATGTSLVVTNRDGLKYPSPQALLDGLVGRLSFDPLAFATMDPAAQSSTLRQLAQIDTTDLDERRKTAYDDRTLANRDHVQARGALTGLPRYPEAGASHQPFDALTAQLDAADGVAARAAADERASALADQAVATAVRTAEQAAKAVADLRVRLAQAEADEDAAQMAVATARDTQQARAAAKVASAARVPDRGALRAQIGAIEARNRQVDANVAYAATENRVAEAKARAEALAAQIVAIDAEKAERLAAATFPIAGLGLSETGVTWQGLPFEQSSTAVRTRVSVAIGLALNPTLKVLLVRNGNDLGEKNLRLLAEMAAEHGAQLWVERIAGATGQTTIVIEDGSVRLERGA